MLLTNTEPCMIPFAPRIPPSAKPSRIKRGPTQHQRLRRATTPTLQEHLGDSAKKDAAYRVPDLMGRSPLTTPEFKLRQHHIFWI